MILLIYNYDSFSYNLYQLIGSLNPEIQVVRNDALTIGRRTGCIQRRSSSHRDPAGRRTRASVSRQ